MTDREALMATILANPDDDLARLVFADWLEEYGDEDDAAHAEWIRVGCELAKTPKVAYKTIQGIPGDVASYTAGVCESCDKSRPDRCQYHLLKIRESELHINLERKMIRRNGLVGFSPSGMSYRESLRHTPPNVVFFDRGFIHAVACDSATWLDHGGELAKREPVEAVTLTTELPLVVSEPQFHDFHDAKHQAWKLRAIWHVTRTDRPVEWHRANVPEMFGRDYAISEVDYLYGRNREERLEVAVTQFRRECRATATVEGYLKMKWPKIKFAMDGGEPPWPGRDLDDAVRYGGFIWIWHHGRWQNRGRDELRFRTYYGREILTWEEYQQRGQRSQRDRLIMGTYEPYMPMMTAAPLSFDYESYAQELRQRMIDSFAIPPAIYNPPITHAASWDDGGGSPIDDLRRAADEIRDQTRGE